jgi:hypothetical protein
VSFAFGVRGSPVSILECGAYVSVAASAGLSAFALAAGNTNPQGIADPPVANEALAAVPVPSNVSASPLQPVSTLQDRLFKTTDTRTIGAETGLPADNTRWLDDTTGWGWVVESTPSNDSVDRKPGDQNTATC